MGTYSWDDGTKEMKPTATAGKDSGIRIGGAIGAGSFGLLTMEILGGLILTIIATLIGFVIGAFIGGWIGAIKDKIEDRKAGL